MSPGGPSLSDRTQAVYSQNAARFDAERTRDLHEEGWLQRFAAQLPAGAAILDLGCGTGAPIAAWLMDQGYRVTGIDFAPAMLDLARARHPEGDWRLGDIRSLDLPGRFDGIIAWNSFFHLSPDEQRAAIPRLARHLAPGGVLMTTVGPRAGTATGQVGGAAVYHASLSPAEYATQLEAAGLRLTAFLAEDPACNRHSVLMACKDT